jgi:hypothetical protein
MTSKPHVLMVSGFWRDDEPGGIAAGMQFKDRDEGLDLCRVLEASLATYDELTLQEVQSELRRLSPRRNELSSIEVMHVIMCVHWMQRRGHLKPDEFNGTLFAGTLEGNVFSTETNPVLMNLSSEMVGDNAVDMTEIIKASKLPDRGLVAAVRAVLDHKRGERTR